METSVKAALTDDHTPLGDTLVARRYFETFDRIVGHLGRVAVEMEARAEIGRVEARVLAGYVSALSKTFRALSLKYLMTGRVEGPLPGSPVFDRHESGFPIAQELLVMANDTLQAEKHLAGMASETELKDRMIRQIVGDLTIPTALQFALSQRLYYETLREGGLFLARNDPVAQWRGENDGRRKWLVSWAVYDLQANLPILYLMDLDDTGRSPLATDSRRWPAVQAHLMAQALGGLKLLTIAQGLDADFDDLHPLRLRRLYVGPMYSHGFTVQSGPLSAILAEVAAEPAQDWALVWTLEDLRAERAETIKDGWFSTRERQIYALDPLRGAETGATRTEQTMIVPERVFQTLAERDPPALRPYRKFVVGAGGRLIAQR